MVYLEIETLVVGVSTCSQALPVAFQDASYVEEGDTYHHLAADRNLGLEDNREEDET